MREKKLKIFKRECELENVVWVFLIYVWVKKRVKICVRIFKMWKKLFKKDYQTALKKTVMASAYKVPFTLIKKKTDLIIDVKFPSSK